MRAQGVPPGLMLARPTGRAWRQRLLGLAGTAWLIAAGPAAAQGTVADPTGDTFGTLVPQLDVTGFSALTDGINLFLTIEFSGAISPGDSGAANAAVGAIEIDIDQNPATGGPSTVDALCPAASGLGSDFTVDLFSYTSASGAVNVVDSSSFAAVGTAGVVYAASSITVVVPLTALADEGIVNTAAVIGTNAEPTDCVPNGDFLTSAFGAPTLPQAALALLLTALIAAGAQRLARPTRT